MASFYPLAYAARQVGGPGIDVSNLTRAGVEPHDLELTPKQAGEIATADVVFYLGGGFQPAVAAAVRGRHGSSIDLLAASGSGGGDPHVWLDPLRYAAIARRIGRALDRPGPARVLAGRLRGLDRAFAVGLSACARHEIVTSHAAFGYLAARYGLRQVALTGIAPEVDPGPRALARLVGVVRRSGATVVFVEPLAAPDLAQTIARGAGITTARLDPIEGITPEAAASGADYFSIMRDNLATLRQALGCR